MSDMIAYLRAYGGISLDEMPPNDIDFLIFAQLSYCDFLSVPGGIFLSEAAQQVLWEYSESCFLTARIFAISAPLSSLNLKKVLAAAQ